MRISALLLLFFTSPALAESDALIPFRKLLVAQSQYLASLEPGETNSGCDARYQRLWKDGTLRVDWYYGYMDSNEVVIDNLVRKETLRALRLPCRRDTAEGACGFKVTSNASAEFGPITLKKNIPGRGVFEIRVWNSTVSNWNDENTVGYGLATLTTAEQKQKTKTVTNSFQHSLRTTEVVIYDGHSRKGSGPGFGPYGLGEMIGGTLFQGSWKATLHALHQAKKKPELLMFSSCESQNYYLPELQRRVPQTAVAATEFAQTFGAGEQMIFSLIDSLAVGRCESEMNKGFRSTLGTDGKMQVFRFDRPGTARPRY